MSVSLNTSEFPTVDELMWKIKKDFRFFHMDSYNAYDIPEGRVKTVTAGNQSFALSARQALMFPLLLEHLQPLCEGSICSEFRESNLSK